MKLPCEHCRLPVVQPHTDPWQCISALRRRLDYFETGAAEIVAQLEREMTGPNDEGDVKHKVQHEGERAYWKQVIENIKRRFQG